MDQLLCRSHKRTKNRIFRRTKTFKNNNENAIQLGGDNLKTTNVSFINQITFDSEGTNFKATAKICCF